MAHGGLANVLCEQNQLESAQAHVQLGLELLEHLSGPGAAIWLYRAQVRVQQANGNWPDALDVLDRAYQNGQSNKINFVVTQAGALRARLQLAQGDLGAAEAWGKGSGLSPDDPEADHPGLREVEYLSLARLLVAQGRPAVALSLLERLLKSAETEGWHGSAIAILILQSLAFQTQGNTTRAHARLERALALAEPEGYVRSFLDEGEVMRGLIGRWRAAAGRLSDLTNAQNRLLAYADRLLAAFETPSGKFTSVPPSSASPPLLPEPLRDREMEVLRLIARGYSNREIADRLVVGLSTVKTHINHLFQKLGVTSRTQALARAGELGLLGD